LCHAHKSAGTTLVLPSLYMLYIEFMAHAWAQAYVHREEP
jgi:hypothetical protein